MMLVFLILGLFVGATGGILVFMLCIAAKTGDVTMYTSGRNEQQRQDRQNVYALAARKKDLGSENVIQGKDIELLFTQ